MAAVMWLTRMATRKTLLRFRGKILNQRTLPDAFRELRLHSVFSGETPKREFEDKPKFPGAANAFYTEKMDFINPDDDVIIPVYRVMDLNGNNFDESQNPKLKMETVQDMYRKMILFNAMERILFQAQRQGRISFYLTNYGEEATQFGSAAALLPEDVIFAQYREAGVLMSRGFTIDDFMSQQCFANQNDNGKGRQMPVHYGSKDLNFVTISSPLATQMPQACGYAYAMKRSGTGNCVICYFGEGTASEGDAHAAFNFAATLEAPLVFFCRNNGYAISTPTDEQYRGDGIAGRGRGYGMMTIRVDGNDVFAVYNVTKAARDIAVKQQRPVLIEAMTYRIGDHSTMASDDKAMHRSSKEVDYWQKELNPIVRLRRYMENKNWWNNEVEEEWKRDSLQQVMQALARADKALKPPVKDMFTDVYDKPPPRLQKQHQECMDHIAKYPHEYPTELYLQDD